MENPTFCARLCSLTIWPVLVNAKLLAKYMTNLKIMKFMQNRKRRDSPFFSASVVRYSNCKRIWMNFSTVFYLFFPLFFWCTTSRFLLCALSRIIVAVNALWPEAIKNKHSMAHRPRRSWMEVRKLICYFHGIFHNFCFACCWSFLIDFFAFCGFPPQPNQQTCKNVLKR